MGYCNARGWSGEIRVVGGRVATPDVNINLYNNTDEAVAVGLRRPSCSDRLATRTTKLLDLDMTALLLLHRGTVHNVLNYLRDNQTLRWEGGEFMFFMDTPTRRTRRQNTPSSFWPWTTTESPGTYTRAVTSLPLRESTEVLQLPNRTQIIQVLRTFRNRPICQHYWFLPRCDGFECQLQCLMLVVLKRPNHFLAHPSY